MRQNNQVFVFYYSKHRFTISSLWYPKRALHHPWTVSDNWPAPLCQIKTLAFIHHHYFFLRCSQPPRFIVLELWLFRCMQRCMMHKLTLRCGVVVFRVCHRFLEIERRSICSEIFLQILLDDAVWEIRRWQSIKEGMNDLVAVFFPPLSWTSVRMSANPAST